LFGLTLVVALCVAAVAAFWLWNDYAQEEQAHEKVLVVRGEAVLAALAGGIRSHRRIGSWLPTNIEVVLDETAAPEGIEGLALFRQDGTLYAKGGEFPAALQPSITPQWVGDGLLICEEAKFVDQGGGPGAGRGRGWGREALESTRPDESSELETLLKNPVWLAVLLDGTEYRQAISTARRRLLVSMSVTLLAIGLGVVAVSLIHRQGRMAAELALAKEQEKRLEEMALLGAGLAHETKNPLGLIRGLGQSLLTRCTGEESEKSRHDARTIVDEADRVVSRINAFLTYARPKPPVLHEVDLRDLVEETAGLFRDEAAAKGVELKVQTDSVRIRADADQVRQVLVNLLANALAACSKGDRVEILTHGEGADGFVLTVRDTGEGIADDDLRNLTKPYFTRREGGTGLGLAIVKHIADGHGWRLQIQSKTGQGSAFSLQS